MARVTVEDCVTKVSNRFDLVLYAGHRGRQISSGSEIMVDRDRDKNPVVALREIADDKLTADGLREEIIHNEQRYVEVDEPEEDEMDMMTGQSEEAVMAEAMEKDVQQSNLEQETLENSEESVIIEPEDE